MIKKKKRIGICVVNFPITKKGVKPIYQLLEILKRNIKNTYLIGGNLSEDFNETSFDSIPYFKVTHDIQKTLFGRMKSYLKTQIMISLATYKLKKNVNIYLFFIGCEGLLIPHIIAKIYHKQTIFLLASFPSKEADFNKDPFSVVQKILSKVNFLISNKILVYSPRIIKERKLTSFQNKIDFFCQSYISESEMKFVKISEKGNTIGFLGEISRAKGIQNLFIAFKMLQYKGDFVLHIGGKGDPYFIRKLMNYANKYGFQDKVIYHEWINRNDIPSFFSKVKYFVLPTISEGIPNVILEAMGCGCCVISTAVGGIPDVIKDSYNGFMVKDNSPKSIYESILKAKSSDLNEISLNAYNTIKEQYSFDNVVKKFSFFLKKMSINNHQQ